jgi:hypothetical protein
MGGRSDSKEGLARNIMTQLNVSRGTAIKAIDEAIKQRHILREERHRGKASPLFLQGGCSDE